MRKIAVDIETYSSVHLKKSGLHRYAMSPDFKILLFAYSVNGADVKIVDLAQGELLPPEIIQALASTEVIKCAFNASFEWFCINRFWYTPISSWRCTMVHSLYCGFTTALGTAGEAIGLAQDKRKLGTGLALIKTFCCPIKGSQIRPNQQPEKWNTFREYCKQDVVAEMALERKLVSFPVPPAEQQLWELDQKINAFGVEIDLDLVNSALECGNINAEALMAEARNLTGVLNPNSRNQLIKWLSTECEETVDKLDKEKVTSLLGEHGALVDRVLHIRQELAKTSVAKYKTMLITEHERRIRGLVQFYGANRTGRFAGRLVQVQNLPKNFIQPLSLARDIVKRCDVELLKLIFDNIPNTLSQLLRTAFVAQKGKLLVIADFSAIESRIVSWLANEKWRMNVFAGEGKIYEASAAAMFGVDVNTIVKGNANYELRQKGKLSELACGYGGSVVALTTMGALKMGLEKSTLPDIITRWRVANPNIVKFWYAVEGAAIEAVEKCRPVTLGNLVFAREMDFRTGVDFLTIRLPSQRKLFYAFPHFTINEWGNRSLGYKGMDQTTKKWSVMETYGGKLVENCVSGGTLVLTEKGWKRIDSINEIDKVWDGVEWVTHSGSVYKGEQHTIKIDGIFFMPNHKILTEKGWRYASQSKGLNWAKVQLPNGYKIGRLKRKEVSLGSSVHLRNEKDNGCNRIWKEKSKILSVYDLINCGPRNRFTVLGESGPFIVHNCTQAIARDCLAFALIQVDKAGYDIVMHIHDEIVIEVEEAKAEEALTAMCSIMGLAIPWAKGLILKGTGFINNYYKKEG